MTFPGAAHKPVPGRQKLRGSTCLEMHDTVDPVLYLQYPRIGALAGGQGALGIEQHTGAQAHTPVVTLQYVIVSTAFATSPELFIIGKFGERHGLVAHARI